LKHAVRRLAASRTFTAVAVLSLAIGIGANAAIFSVIRVLILDRLPVSDAEELALVYWHQPGTPAISQMNSSGRSPVPASRRVIRIAGSRLKRSAGLVSVTSGPSREPTTGARTCAAPARSKDDGTRAITRTQKWRSDANRDRSDGTHSCRLAARRRSIR
jgi:hypothetical protein